MHLIQVHTRTHTHTHFTEKSVAFSTAITLHTTEYARFDFKS